MSTDPVPAEWRDPHVVMPHLAQLLSQWHAGLLQLDQDLAVVQGALDIEVHLSAIEHERARAQVLEWVTVIRAQLGEVARQVASRATAYQTVAEQLGKEVQ